MTDIAPDILSDSFLNEGKVSRKSLIPLWIKIFSWIFLVFGFFTPIILIAGIFMQNITLSLYGLEAYTPYSLTGGFITALFMFKGIVAFGILKSEDWAVKFGIIDAIMGIIVCVALMIYPMFSGGSVSFRGELLLLIPYLIKLVKIKDEWARGYKN